MVTQLKIGRMVPVLLMASILFLNAPPQAQEICEFYLTTCPREFDGDTIHVAQNIIAMGPRVHGCEGDSTSSDSGGPPAIMFVIDNSGSMSGLGSGPNDRMGSRFSVTLALIDSIYAKAHDAQVGVAVFQNTLYFDHRDDPFFAQLPGNIDNVPDQSYVPLTTLNARLTGNTLGIDKLKQVLAIDTSVARLADNTTREYVHLTYKPADTSNLTLSTNINVGFKAAVEAFKTSTRPHSRQFIIFFSDGEPTGTMQAGENQFWFRDSCRNDPTTFTVFFTPTGTAPTSLTTMTQNISTNNYSIINKKSNLWALAASHDTLLSLLTNNVMGTILSGSPSSMIVSAITLSDTSTVYVNNYFVFSERFPLQSNITPFRLPLSYRYTDLGTDSVRDTVVNINFFVKRDTGNVSLPQGVAKTCWTRTIQFTSGGNPVVQLTNENQPIGIRFSTEDPLTGPVNVLLQSSLDTESVVLIKSGQYWSGSIPGFGSDSALHNDGKLQHRSTDSIVVIYRNPKLPLDTIRLAVPYVDISGPAIKRIVFFQGPKKSSDDTLIITFNAPINCQSLMSVPPESVFVYYDAGVANSAVLQGSTFLGSCGSTYISQVRILLPSSQWTVMPWEDSVVLVPGNLHVFDSSGVYPPARSTKRVIESGAKSTIELAVSPNPVKPGEPLDPKIRQTYANVIGNEMYGTLISIYSKIPLKQLSVGSVVAYGKADIYDAVGNLVQTNLPVLASDRPAGVYGVYWGLRNRNSRIVGNGTYLVVVYCTDMTGHQMTKKIKIGVKG